MDQISEFAGQGFDQVVVSRNFILTEGADVEIMRISPATQQYDIQLHGNTSGNEIIGHDGNNWIWGNGGQDFLTGGGGWDHFYFDFAPGEDNLTAITDFTVEEDHLSLERAQFPGITTSGAGIYDLPPSQVNTGAAAQDASDRVIYNDATGALYYDADGTGPTEQVQFAELPLGLSLTFRDFIVYY